MFPPQSTPSKRPKRRVESYRIYKRPYSACSQSSKPSPSSYEKATHGLLVGPTLSTTRGDKYYNQYRPLSEVCPRDRGKVVGTLQGRAIKEESKVANRDWVDHQAWSLLQYINVIANLLIIGNYFNKLRWKIIRANNLFQSIHQVTIELRFRNSLAQERFKSNLEFRYQIIVSPIKFRNSFAEFMIPIALFKKFLS